MTAQDTPRVCVAIVAYKSTATLSQCLASLAAQDYRSFRVLLIDNASAENPAASFDATGLDLTYIPNATNAGFAGAMTQALAETKEEFLVALNPDAYPQPGWLSALVQAADGHSDFAAVGSVQRDAANPDVLDGFGDHLLAWGLAWRGRTLPDISADLYESFGVCAAAALYRTAALKAVGGFDDRFFCFYEDVDVSFRLRLAGYRCGVARGAVVDHVGGASFTGLSDLAERLIARNQMWMLLKNMPLTLLLAILPGYTMFLLIAVIRRPMSARVKGVAEGLKGVVPMWRARASLQNHRKASIGNINAWLSWNPADFRDRLSKVTPVPDNVASK
jgi:GT2 family glycosyltransferase